MRIITMLLAAFAIVFTQEASAPCQTPTPPVSEAQKDQTGVARAEESSDEDEVVRLKKKLPSLVFNFAAPIKSSKNFAGSPPINTNWFSLAENAQAQNTPSASPQSGSPQAAPPQGAEGADLAKQLSNPIASLISMPFQMNWDTGVGPNKDTRTTFNIQPVMPFKLNDDWNFIARLIIPLVSQPPLVPGGETTFGMSDFLFSGFFSPSKPKGFVWGVGPALLVPVTSEPTLGTEKVALGPTVVILKQIGGATVGALANHLWSITGDNDRADVNQTFIQPFLAYTTKTAWTFSINSEMSVNWEARAGEEVTAPINLGITKLVRLGRQPISLGPTVGYFIDQPSIGPKWKARFTLTLLFPITK